MTAMINHAPRWSHARGNAVVPSRWQATVVGKILRRHAKHAPSSPRRDARQNRGLFGKPDVACQRDGTTVLPRAWDHLGVWLIMAVIGRSGQRRHAVRVGFVGGRTVLR